jgi:carbon monoxide dehydrogenase subunit G
MKIEGRYQIPAPADRIYAALQDPDVLTRCIPGCEKMEKSGDDRYRVTLKLGVAAIRGSYTGSIAIADKRPGEALTLQAEGSGAPGFVKGQGRVVLTEQAEATELAVEGDAQVGGKVAAVGQRMLGGVSKQLMNEFFNRLKAEFAPA